MSSARASMPDQTQTPSRWATRRADKHRRLARVASIADGMVLPTDRIVDVLQALVAPGDRVVVEGNNQKQADFLSRSLAKVDYGIVHAQVNEIVDDPKDLPRVDIPGSWIDFVVQSDKPFFIEPLFTRDPRLITPIQVLMAMMAIRGIYERHQVQSLNHGIGFNTAAIELILPTYGERLGLKGKICRHWTLNPHPTLIPAIETGWVESVHCFGGELGMEAYVAQRPDIFFTGRDGSMRSNRTMCQLAGQYAVDM